MALRLIPRGGSLARKRLLAASALGLALVALYADPRAAHPASPARAHSGAVRVSAERTIAGAGAEVAARPDKLTLVTDSVMLGAVGALRAALPGWHVQVLGRPALMINQAGPRYLPPGRKVAPTVVVGLGYNSLWQPHEEHFAAWAAQFDRQADTLVTELRNRGAEKIVWVTLREPTPGVVTKDGLYQYSHYAWYFPYVNARLRALAHRDPDVTLADWGAVSDRTGLTYDLIHLDPDGARLMAHLVAGAIKA
jgi:hypothetical protein